MHYQTFGDIKNPPVIFLHGFLGSSNDWQEVVSHLSEEFFCLTLDLPGHGKTVSTDPEQYTFNRIAIEIKNIIAELNLTEINLVAYSMGGRVAFYLITRYPKMFSKTIIESAHPGLKTETEKLDRIKQDNKNIENLKSQNLDVFLTNWYNLPLFSTIDKSSEKYKEFIIRRKKNNPEALALSLEFMGTGKMPPLWEKLDKIETDILLITGSKDGKYSKLATDINKHIPQSFIETVDGAGHNVHYENPDEYIKIVRKFLSK